MPDPFAHERLIDDLASSLRPVRRLPAPTWRACAWLSAILGMGLVMSLFADTASLASRFAVPDLRYAAFGAAATAVAAAMAAFQSSVPGRSSLWSLLPLPPLTLWLGASGLGCLRGWLAPGTDLPDAHEMRGCFVFLMAVSVPLSALLVLMLRRACPLRPTLTAALGGLAAASAAAALLVPFHPHDATATDLLVHCVAVLLIVGANGLLGGRLLDARRQVTGREKVRASL